MTQMTASGRGDWFGFVSTSATAVVVGFASTILLIMEGVRAVGANDAQQASCAAALCFGMAATTLLLSWRYRMPIITAWSTPGAALIATSAGGVNYADALGAYVCAGLLMVIAGLIKPLERAIERIPAPIASAMLGGVLFHYTMTVPGAAVAMPFIVLPLIVVFFALRLSWPLFAVPITVVLGILSAALAGKMGGHCCSFGLTELQWTTPTFHPASIVSLGIPLFLVTMASQNLPGFAVLRAAGYQPPVSPALLVTGAGSMAIAPFGGHAVNLAAITAAIVTGPETHPDPARRWMMAIPYFGFYIAVGLAAASFVQVLGSLPSPLITAIAGLALFSPLMASMTAMVKEPRDVETALVTFLVTASGISLFGVGAAFWGLVSGLILFGARHLRDRAASRAS